MFVSRSHSIDLGGTAEDNGFLESVNWSSPNGGSGLANGTSEWQIDGLALAQGVNLVTVEATDEAGNLGSVEVSVVSDPSAPFESAGSASCA